jgi:hypothetical protein
MKKLMTMALAVAAITTTGLMSCNESASQPQTPITQLEPAPTVTEVPATLEFTPIQIAASEVVEEFTPYPECDGGQCYTVEYIVAVKDSQGKSYTGVVNMIDHSDEKGSKPKFITDVVLLQKTITSVKPEQVHVTVRDGVIEKMVTKEQWNGNTYTPEQLLYEAAMKEF